MGEDKCIKRWKESKGSIKRSEFPSFTETTWLKKCKSVRIGGHQDQTESKGTGGSSFPKWMKFWDENMEVNTTPEENSTMDFKWKNSIDPKRKLQGGTTSIPPNNIPKCDVQAHDWNHHRNLVPACNEGGGHPQRALIREKGGFTDALLIDQMAIGEAQDRRSTMLIAWIDYQKPFDRVPHRWLFEMLEAIGAPKEICKTMQHVISLRRTTFTVGVKEQPLLPLWMNLHRRFLCEGTFCLKLGRGIFQGDSITTAVLSGYYPGLRGIEKDRWIPFQIDGEAVDTFIFSRKFEGLRRKWKGFEEHPQDSA